MLGAGRSFADSSDVLSDLSRQIAYMTSIPRILLICGTAFGNSGQFTANQKAKSQQQGPDCHSTPPSSATRWRRLQLDRAKFTGAM
jgi:hypothetical protein